MRPLSSPHGTSSPGGWPPSHLSSSPEILVWNQVSTKSPIHLLSVGRIDPGSLIRDAILDGSDFVISFVKDYRELWIASKEEEVDIVLIHNSLCSFELEEAASLVRSRWPKAQILIIRSGEVPLEDALYDDRLPPPVTAKMLLATLSKMSAKSQVREAGNGDR